MCAGFTYVVSQPNFSDNAPALHGRSLQSDEDYGDEDDVDAGLGSRLDDLEALHLEDMKALKAENKKLRQKATDNAAAIAEL